MPQELSRTNSSEKYIYIYVYEERAEDVCTVAWQQRNKASMMSDKRIVGTQGVLLYVSLIKEHGKQRWWTVNGTRTIEKTFYQCFWFQRRQSGRAESLICKSRCHQSFDPQCTLPRALRGSARDVFLVKLNCFRLQTAR